MVLEVYFDDEEFGSIVMMFFMSIIQEFVVQFQFQFFEEVFWVEEIEVGFILFDNLFEEVILEDGEEFEDLRLSDNYQLLFRRMVVLFDYDLQILLFNFDSEVRIVVDQDMFFLLFYILLDYFIGGWKEN